MEGPHGELQALSKDLSVFLTAILEADIDKAKGVYHVIVHHRAFQKHNTYGTLMTARIKRCMDVLNEQINCVENNKTQRMSQLSKQQLNNISGVFSIFTVLVKQVERLPDIDDALIYMNKHYVDLVELVVVKEDDILSAEA